MEKTMGAREAASLLGVTRQTLYKWLAEGRITGRRLPSGYWRFTESDLEKAYSSAESEAS